MVGRWEALIASYFWPSLEPRNLTRAIAASGFF
jgi:hypothetical protein